MGQRGSSERSFDLYGITLRTDYCFRNRLVDTQALPDVLFRCSVGPLASPAPDAVVWDSRTVTPEDSAEWLWRFDGGFVLRFEDTSSFAVSADRIEARVRRAADMPLVEMQFLGRVLALWLEWRGTTVLHASAVEVEDRLVGFLGGSGAGKTSLAAALATRGCGLITDDLLALRVSSGKVLGHSAYPQLRMWPDTVRHLAPGARGDRVHPDFAKLRLPLLGPEPFIAGPRRADRLCIIERRGPHDPDGEIRIEPVPQPEATIELLRYSFGTQLTQALGLAAPRLARLAIVSDRIPLLRLSYPSGYSILPVVCEAVLACDSPVRRDGRAGELSNVS